VDIFSEKKHQETQSIRQRVYLGGLASDIQPADIEQRLRPFGVASDISIARDCTGGKE
jgi:hypothetical protein